MVQSCLPTIVHMLGSSGFRFTRVCRFPSHGLLYLSVLLCVHIRPTQRAFAVLGVPSVLTILSVTQLFLVTYNYARCVSRTQPTYVRLPRLFFIFPIFYLTTVPFSFRLVICIVVFIPDCTIGHLSIFDNCWCGKRRKIGWAKLDSRDSPRCQPTHVNTFSNH